ncbi:iron-containing alcohol dehydrogenase family protein [Sutterella sp.]|uniref:iron-containing alcohol dehydrogenase family protein n=1 Tax=Sutterella sp. TaxID=1981025 RepID=UPI0026E0504D|nr:iron-containing alcohol dehydrogenase family protein [Sutterella sp.]MDO5531933.1 iron-containing alcohol dehydrogenase family protein [Sutterella sp.]
MAQNYTVTLPNYSIGPDCYNDIGDVCRFYGKTVAVIGGETALAKAGDALRAGFEKAGIEIVEWSVYGKDATLANIERITSNEKAKNADMLFGVGGGRAIDTVKTAADILGKPFFSCPTVGSNCAPVSAIGVLYNEDGSLHGYHFTKRCPEHCFINTSVVLDSPEDLFWAGIGDALSKQAESQLASRGKELTHTPLLGVQVGLVCEEPLLELGAQALEDFRAKKLTSAFSETVLDIIISTGITSNLTTTKDSYYYNSSLAHCFYNASMVLPAIHKHLHGEVVSFGTLVLHAVDGDDEALERLMKFNRSVKLPVTLAEMDITTPEQVDALVDRATSIKEWGCVPYQMTKERFREGIYKVDRLGRELIAKEG